MRGLLTLCVGILSTSVFASFDLVYVADAGNDAIHRFDGGSGAYLGSMGAGMLVDPQGIYADTASNRLFVTASNGTFQFSLWSGELLNAVGVYSGQHIAKHQSGNMLFAVNYSSNFFGGLIPGNDSWYTGAILPDTSTRANFGGYGTLFGCTVGTTWKEYSAPTWGGSATNTRNITLTGGTYTGQIAMSAAADYHLVAGGTNGSVGIVYKTALGNSWVNTSLTTARGVAFGHGNTFYAAGTMSTTGAVQVMTTSAGYPLRTFGTSYLVNPTAVATIIAPEPASLTALAAGAFILLRRRRSA